MNLLASVKIISSFSSVAVAYSLGIWLHVGVLHCPGVTMRLITEGFITPHVQTDCQSIFFHVGTCM